MRRIDETKRAKTDTWTRKTCRIAVLSLLLVSSSGCSIMKEMTNDSSPTTQAFFFGGVIAGAPVAIACLPLTFPIGMQAEGWGGVAIMAGPAIPTGVVGGVLLAAPVAILDFVIGGPIRFVKRRRERREEAEARGGPEFGSPPARPRRANPARPPRVGWAPKPPPRLRLRAGAVPPICEPAVQRDIQERTELERTLIPLRPAGRRR